MDVWLRIKLKNKKSEILSVRVEKEMWYIVIQEMCPGLVITRFGVVNWPPRSWDWHRRSPFLWAYAKDRTYGEEHLIIEYLKTNIRQVMAELPANMYMPKSDRKFFQMERSLQSSHDSHLNDVVFLIYCQCLKYIIKEVSDEQKIILNSFHLLFYLIIFVDVKWITRYNITLLTKTSRNYCENEIECLRNWLERVQ